MIPKSLLLVEDKDGRKSLLDLYKRNSFKFHRFNYDAVWNLQSPLLTAKVKIKTMAIDGEDYRVTIKSISSEEFYYDGKRHPDWENLSEFDVFIVVFSVVEPDTFIIVKKAWIPYMKQHHQDTPIILVGNKTDLRSKSKRSITSKQGYKFAQEINAAKYLECSYNTTMGVRNIFYEAVWATLGPIPKDRNESDPQPKCNKSDTQPKCCDVS